MRKKRLAIWDKPCANSIKLLLDGCASSYYKSWFLDGVYYERNKGLISLAAKICQRSQGIWYPTTSRAARGWSEGMWSNMAGKSPIKMSMKSWEQQPWCFDEKDFSGPHFPDLANLCQPQINRDIYRKEIGCLTLFPPVFVQPVLSSPMNISIEFLSHHPYHQAFPLYLSFPQLRSVPPSMPPVLIADASAMRQHQGRFLTS